MDKPASSKLKPEEQGQKWLDKIRAAGKREDDWLQAAAKAESVYLNQQKDGAGKYYFNILHSNIETIVPAIYSATPKPDIRRRFNDNDPIAKEASTMLERGITVQIDDGALDTEIEGMALASFSSGRGIIRIRLVQEDIATGDVDDDTQETADETASTEDTESNTETEAPEIAEGEGKIQRLTFEAVSWRDYRQGPAKRWRDVPWVAFRHMIPEEQIKEWSKREDVAAQIKAVSAPTEDGGTDNAGDVAVWEVWCKASKTVKFIRETDGVVFESKADPLNLAGFFPCCRPVQPIERVGDLTPVCPFSIYEELADELDRVTRRIRKLIEGVKVRGGAAAGEMMKGIAEIAGLDDNEIAEIRGVEAFAQQGGLEKGITWWPIEKAIEAIQALAQHRESIKNTIYEVTGISDIVRGASMASETATAQQIKSQWGSLRIQKMQRMIERAVRELFVMAAELIATKFTPETLTAITGIEYTPEIDAIFKSRVDRMYRIDVETDSTIKSDMSKSKSEMAEFLQGTAQYVQAMGPLVQQGVIPAPMAVEIYSSFARTFRLGKQTDDILAQLADQAKEQAAQPQEPQIPPEMQQQMEQAQMRMQEMGEEIQRLTEENQKLKGDQSLKQADMQMKAQSHGQDMQFKAEKHQMDMATAEQKAQAQAKASLSKLPNFSVVK